jgi:hypothetical protein
MGGHFTPPRYKMRVHQLQEQEKKFRDAVETMPALAFVADPRAVALS